jgi:carbamoyltransferase
LRESPFENIWIQPAAGDAGGALGAALFIWYQLLGNERKISDSDTQQGSLLGPEYSDTEIKNFLDSIGAKYHFFDNEEKLLDCIADLVEQEKVIGWFQGRMEFGPRALGCRSIIGDARSEKMQSVMNLKIKFRESFRSCRKMPRSISKCPLATTVLICCWSPPSKKKNVCPSTASLKIYTASKN